MHIKPCTTSNLCPNPLSYSMTLICFEPCVLQTDRPDSITKVKLLCIDRMLQNFHDRIILQISAKKRGQKYLRQKYSRRWL